MPPVDTPTPMRYDRLMGTIRRSSQSYTDQWCWEATLDRLGIPAPPRWSNGKHPAFAELTDRIRWSNRYSMECLIRGYGANVGDPVALSRFVNEHPTGMYLLYTHAHVMLLDDGTLTDTATGRSGKRRVKIAYRLDPIE